MGDADRELALLHTAYGCLGGAATASLLMVAAHVAGDITTLGVAAGIALVLSVAVLLILWSLRRGHVVELRRDWWGGGDSPDGEPLPRPVVQPTAEPVAPVLAPVVHLDDQRAA